MAYIHKAIVYFIDPNEEFESTKAIAEEMRNYDHLPYMRIGQSETKDFDWDDDVVVNRGDCTGEQAEAFFQNVKPKGVIPTHWYRVIIGGRTGVVEDIRFLNSYREAFYQKVYESSTMSALDGSSKSVYYIDVEAEGPEQAEYIAKQKVLDYVRDQAERLINELRRRFFK